MGTVLHVCSEDGDRFELIGDCAPASCDAGMASCTCTPGTRECDGNTLLTCNDEGTQLSSEECGDAACVHDACELDLIARWTMDEAGGDATHDVVDALRCDLSDLTWEEGHVGSGIAFDVPTGVLACGDVVNTLQIPFTVTFWIYRKAEADGPIVVTDYGDIDNYYGFAFMIINGGLFAQIGNGGFASPASRHSKHSNADVPVQRWVQVAAVINGIGDIAIYVDGVDVGGTYDGKGNGIMQSADPMVLGGTGGPTALAAVLDDVRFYGRGLSRDEVAALAGD